MAVKEMNLGNSSTTINLTATGNVVGANLKSKGSSSTPVYFDSNGVAQAINIADFCNLIYPVGSIYMSINDVNPATLFGGTWERWAAGRMPVGAYPTLNGYQTSEITGGEPSVKLTEAQLPNVSGSLRVKQAGAYKIVDRNTADDTLFTVVESGGNRFVSDIKNEVLASPPLSNSTLVTMSFGNDKAHNNMPPYITCFMWKRTA